MFIDLSLLNTSGMIDSSTITDQEQALLRQGHSGTHLDRYLGTAIPMDYVSSRGVKIDISGFSRQRSVEMSDLPVGSVMPGDFVIFHTGSIERNGYGTPGYMAEHIELSWELIDALLALPVRFIGIDNHGIRMKADHIPADKRCEEAGVFVIENMNNTQLLPTVQPFKTQTAWWDLGVSGLPCRVAAELSAE